MEDYETQIKKCDVCDSNATCLCFKCILYFCESCFKFVHEKKKNISHKKDALDLYIPYNLKCKIHPLNPISLFCLEEKGNCIKNTFYFIIIYLIYRIMLFILYF